MNSIDDFRKWFLNLLENEGVYKRRKMRRVFQWKRYLDWQNLSQEERLGAKRFLCIPLIAYIILLFIKQYAVTTLFLISIYLIYKKFEKGKLMK